MQLQKTLYNVISKECSVQVFGLGYVGLPLAIRLAGYGGFSVFGIDTDSKKIDELKSGKLVSSLLEVEDIFLESLQNHDLELSTSSRRSILPRVGIICVPTPVKRDSHIDKPEDSEEFVFSAVKEFLNNSEKGDVIIVESSVRTGTLDKIIEMINNWGYKVGEDFGVCFCPERIDPLNQKWKLENIPRVIYASDDTTYTISQKIYQHVNNSNLVRVSSARVAEVVKSYENAFRLVNISLVNELAILCDHLQIDIKEVVNAAATKPFGFMPFKSGAGAGGHCIPKDPTFLLDSAKQKGVNFSTIQNALEINNSIIPRHIAQRIAFLCSENNLRKSVLVCGLAYKANIEDMRDSPGFKIAKELQGLGFRVGGYDPYFKESLLKRYLVENHLSELPFELQNNIDDDENLEGYDAICVVQHHSKVKRIINEIYKTSLVKLIYDCQNRIEIVPKSMTVLRGLGMEKLNRIEKIDVPSPLKV